MKWVTSWIREEKGEHFEWRLGGGATFQQHVASWRRLQVLNKAKNPSPSPASSTWIVHGTHLGGAFLFLTFLPPSCVNCSSWA